MDKAGGLTVNSESTELDDGNIRYDDEGNRYFVYFRITVDGIPSYRRSDSGGGGFFNYKDPDVFGFPGEEEEWEERDPAQPPRTTPGTATAFVNNLRSLLRRDQH